MAKFNVPVLKRCRSLGISPTYIGINKTSNRKPQQSFKKLSEYGTQLREKQRAKFIYDVGEKQFRNYFERASRTKGITGEELLKILESRLDNILFRAGFAKTRPQAKQMISHGAIEVNGRKTDIASFIVKAGDVIKVRETKKEHPVIKENLEAEHIVTVPEWLEVDKKDLSIKVIRIPERDEIDIPIEEHLIVELYSK